MEKGLDLTSPTWRVIERFAQTQIAVLRERNDSLSLDATRTAELRGRIQAFKELLALDKPDPAITPDVGY